MVLMMKIYELFVFLFIVGFLVVDLALLTAKILYIGIHASNTHLDLGLLFITFEYG